MNHARLKGQYIRNGDTETSINVEIGNQERKVINALKYIRLYNDLDDGFIEIEMFEVSNNIVKFKLPELPANTYYIEISDIEGRIYPSDDTLSFNVIKSTHEALSIVFEDYRDIILSESKDGMIQYINDNKNMFKGEKGDTGVVDFDEITPEQMEMLKGEKGDRGAQGDPGEKGDPGAQGDPGEISIDGFVDLRFVPHTVSQATSYDITEYNVIENTETITGGVLSLNPGHWSVNVSLMFESGTSPTNYLYLRKGNANFLSSVSTSPKQSINAVIKVLPGENVSLRLYSNSNFTVVDNIKNYATFKYLGQL